MDISRYVEDALRRLRQETQSDVRLVQGTARVKMRSGRSILYVVFELERPAKLSAEEWMESLTQHVNRESGYGQAEVVLDSSGEVVGGRVEVSYDLQLS